MVMRNEEGLEALVVLYTVAFFAGSFWDLLLPSRTLPGYLEVFHDILPHDSILFFASLPILGGLFFGLLGMPLSLYLGYEHREVFTALAEIMKADLASGYPSILEPSMHAFACYAAWMILAISGSTLGASFSYLHEDSRVEMLLSALVYIAAAAFLSIKGGCL
jgi:hypothetical protein